MGGEFDFEAMAANMNELEHEKEEFNQNNDENYGGYVQDDFFDDISTSLENKGEDDDHYKQYEINNETFGFVNRRGRGRGGRGRGNYRGNYRGGYNNNYRGGYNNNRGGYNNNRDNNNRDGVDNNQGGYRSNYNRGGYQNNGYQKRYNQNREDQEDYTRKY